MSDIKCVVCGEPFNAWGVNHGDMMAWETDLFRKGAGCPCCLGEAPEGGFDPQSIFDFENGDGDPGDRIAAFERAQAGKAPKWKEPDNERLRKCDGCGVELQRSLATEVYDGDKRKKEYVWHFPFGSRAGNWYHSHSERNMGDPAEAADPEQFNWTPWDADLPEDRRRVACPCCRMVCSHGSCTNIIAAVPEVEPEDSIYGEGASVLPEGCYNTADSVCRSCHDEHYCSECGSEYGEGDDCESCNPPEPEEPEESEEPEPDRTKSCTACDGIKWLREAATGEAEPKSELVQCQTCKGTGLAPGQE